MGVVAFQQGHKAPYPRAYDEYYDSEDENSGLRLVRKSGIPLLYVVAVCTVIVGMICLAIITDYWAHLEQPMCFLYSQSASSSQVYQFGSTLSNCYWVSYGAVPSVTIAIICGALYMMKVFTDPQDEEDEQDQVFYLKVVLAGMFVAALLLLGVCCTLAEGMRITCTNMGLNSVNGKADSCMDKLNLRVEQYSLPVDTSIMVHFGSAGLWTGMVAFTLLVIFHSISVCRTT
ncbi:hypothetical protein FHG87_006973 [Trinorchestia longiramus]|nr:hypothetical protein FHG87_006973 [Trinorchestia longiramus]